MGKLWVWLVLIIVIVALGVGAYFMFFNEKDECQNIADQGEKNNCYINLAREQQDISVCDKKVVGEDYLTTCYSALASETKDTSLCDEIKSREEITSCYRGIAVKNGDKLVCDLIEDEGAIEECYIYVAEELGDASICREISGNIDGCNRRVAIARDDRELCYGIQLQIEKDLCLSKTSE